MRNAQAVATSAVNEAPAHATRATPTPATQRLSARRPAPPQDIYTLQHENALLQTELANVKAELATLRRAVKRAYKHADAAWTRLADLNDELEDIVEDR